MSDPKAGYRKLAAAVIGRTVADFRAIIRPPVRRRIKAGGVRRLETDAEFQSRIAHWRSTRDQSEAIKWLTGGRHWRQARDWWALSANMDGEAIRERFVRYVERCLAGHHPEVYAGLRLSPFDQRV